MSKSSKMSALLVAEDDEHIAKLILFKLSQGGWDVDWVPNGREALSALSQKKYDLFILDVMMPEMDGWEVLSHLEKENKTVPVLLLTARGQKEDEARAMQKGVLAFLRKPFDPEDLFQKVKEILKGKK